MNSVQRKTLHKWFSTSRYLYNKTLEQSKRQKINFQSLRNQFVTKQYNISYCSECYEIHVIKQKCCGKNVIKRKLSNLQINEWETETPKEIRANAVKDVVKAYKTCFSQKHTFKMHFRSKKRNIGSLGIQKQSISFKNKRLYLYSTFLNPIKLGKRTIKRMKEINHDCRLTFDGLYFNLIIPYKKNIKELKQTETIALDPGLRTFQTGFSQGMVIEIDRTKLLNKLKKKLDFLCSKRRLKYKRQKKQRQITNVVDDLHWKTIDFLTKHYKNIILPEFESQEMMGKNKNVNRSFNILKHYRFKTRLKEKINEIKDLNVYIVNESYTSKTCSQCGIINVNLGSKKTFICSDNLCNIVIDRDINAARNIFIKHCS